MQTTQTTAIYSHRNIHLAYKPKSVSLQWIFYNTSTHQNPSTVQYNAMRVIH